MNKGFTLIELLVVVLIIGILSSIAWPKYQKAIEKSRSAQALVLVKAVYEAGKAYKVASGTTPTSFDELNVDIPWTGRVMGNSEADDVYDVRSNDDWSIQLQKRPESASVFITRLRGKYLGGGWTIRWKTDTDAIPVGQLQCTERMRGGYNMTLPDGSYCEKLFGGTYNSGVWARYYRLP